MITQEKRKEITLNMYTDLEKSASTPGDTSFIVDMEEAIKKDNSNRLECIDKIKQIYGLENEFKEITANNNLFLTYGNVTYYSGYIYIDSPEIWDSAILTNKNNLFFYSTEIGTQKYDLTPGREYDLDGTSTIHPSIPTSLLTHYTSTSKIYPVEKSVIEALTFYINLYKSSPIYQTINGTIASNTYNQSYDGTENTGSFMKYGTNPSEVHLFSIGDIIYIKVNSPSPVYAAAKVVKLNYVNEDLQVKLQNMSDAASTSNYSVTIQKEIPSQAELEELIKSLINNWKTKLLSIKDGLNNLITQSSNDTSSITDINSKISTINSWVALSDVNKFLTVNLDLILDDITSRNNFIATRTTQINNYFSTYDRTSLGNLIKSRINKMSGSLADVAKTIVNKRAKDLMNGVTSTNENTYGATFVVKKVLKDCDNSKMLFIKEISSLSVNDIVYVISENIESEKQVKILEMSQETLELIDNMGLTKEETVYKIVFDKRMTKEFTVNNKTRLVRQLKDEV